ncbi:hypothetical protein PAXRUDRAFT_833092 [Paxillus rubicundulus Ve08.2h10]|uniref:Meiotic sister chromatid recombination protein 1 n=1 Tax=Paxillus rubicundulus Ve08.2h10 TaxID=930991 RepID=A0A0D0CZI8_9AGAM|nr:hypothetical protein PAXRUDRAFT_833092 [Paxillus rubicundulus Ve08.2h10]
MVFYAPLYVLLLSVVLAKQKHCSYTGSAAHYTSIASVSASSAHAGVTDCAYSASQSVSSAAAQAAREVARAIDDSRDYVYSTWDDNRLRSWLEEHGVVEAKKASTREELTKLANEFYRKAADPLWESWSDSYIREWLIAHNLLKPSDVVSRSSLRGEMEKYYYSISDKVWNTWSDSELQGWLVEHGFLKIDAQKKRDELVKMVEDHYFSASDSVWGAWSDSDIRQWLSEKGYFDERNEAKKRRDKFVELMSKKYADPSAKSASYLVWPDARLRAYLREQGVSESALPTSRPGLLQETRIRWVQASNRAETIFSKLKEIVNSSVEVAEEKLARILEVLSGHSHDTSRYASEKVHSAREHADVKTGIAWNWGLHKADKARENAAEAGEYVKQKGLQEPVKSAGESVKWAGEKVKSAGDEL